MKPVILTHGGAGAWRDSDDQATLVAMQQATAAGWAILAAGGSALDAVEKAVNVLEDHPLFDAGFGSFLNSMGEVEMDALIADGRGLNFGAVAAVRRVRYAISLARGVMERTPYCFFVGDGADRLAAELGMPLISNLDLVTDANLESFRRRKERIPEPLGTVGAVALDSQGNLASATSTGGVPDKPPGRVGDSPIFGAGGYADNRFGAASATGKGENVMRVLLSRYAIDQIAAGMTAQEAAAAASRHVSGHFKTPDTGIIVVDRDGNIGASHTTHKMPIGWIDAGGAIHVLMSGRL